MSKPRPSMRLAAAVLGVLAFSFLSCGREPTGPSSRPVDAFRRTASLAFAPQYESTLRASALEAALTQVAFEKVRVTLHRDDGSIALDTVVTFPAGSASLTLSLKVLLPPSAPSTGVPFSLSLAYVSAAGDTVFRGGPMPVTVIPTDAGGTAPSPVEVPVRYTGTGANAASVVISPKTAGGLVGQSASFSAVARASDGSAIAGTPIVFSSSDAGVVRIGNPSLGTADFIGRGTAKVYALLLTGQSDSATVTVTLPASRIALESGGDQSAPAGTTLPQPIVARVLASDGVGVGGVTVTFAVQSGGGSVTAASVVSASDGRAATSWRLGSGAGTQALSVTASGLGGSPLAVSATATVIRATQLKVTTQPVNGVAGAPLADVIVAAQDPSGVTVANFTGDVTVALGSNPGGATLGGTTTVTAVNGVATFSGLTLNKPGTGYTLTFSSSGLSGATSTAFNILPGSAAKLTFGAMPATVDAGLAIVPAIQVMAQDGAGNTVTSFTGAVTLAIGSNAGGATLSGTLTRNAVAGVATFGDLSLNRKGSSYTLVASASGLAGGTSAPFNVAATAPTNLTLISGGGQTAATGAALAPIVLQLRDAVGNGITGATITLAVASGGGSLGAPSLVTDDKGMVSVAWTLGGTAGTQSITATYTGVPTLTITATATAGTGNKLALTTPPTPTQTAGLALAPNVVVQAQDASGVLQTAFTGAVTATVQSGPAGGALTGTTSVNAVGGIATFSALRLRMAGTYVIQFAATGYSSVSTTSIVVNPAPAKTIVADSGNAQSGTAGAALPVKLVVLVTDSLGNPVSATPVTWAVASGGGALSGATTATDPNGRARATFTLGGVAGANSATAASTGLTGSPVTFTATGILGAIASTTMVPHLDTLTALNATFALTAQSKDASANVVPGTFTWVSRTPAIATVSAVGLVTAIANGTTYVVATESGGTKDSALIVVQQRLATINVTPATRNIYLGATYQFAASAVDGLGSPIASQPSFTWSTASGAIATVSSAGLATGTGLGTTNVKATAGTVTGQATLNVLTPIIRIVVSRDSAGFATTVNDTFTLAALGNKRSYRATARDTLDNPIAGITFSWTSSNASVASLDSINTATVRATAAANGSSGITATAQGVSGAATLNVQQVLTKIHLTPATAAVAPTGSVSITARGVDANGFFMPGGTFSFASSLPSIATVAAGTGVVTGVAPGTTLVTATSGAVGSDTSTITVGAGVPATISFGRDTLTIGRSATSVSVPVYLSKPSATPVKILLAVADTSAYFSASSITIAAGATSGNALLNGHNAATTHITATDSAAVYTAGTAVLAVQATVRLTTTYYYLNVTDKLTTQVLLSDPAPAGGTYVTYNYGTAGIGAVSPSPAYIPAGQLAATVVLQATGAGSTTITPSASGASGIASTLSTYAAALSNYPSTLLLGAGQYETYPYVRVQTYMNNALAIALANSDTTKVTVPSGIVIPLNGYLTNFTVTGKTVGASTITSSATGWTPSTTAVTVTTPKVRVCCGSSYPTTQPALGVTLYAADSTTGAHYRTSSLVVSLSSSDSTILKVLTPTVTIPSGQYSTYVYPVIAGGATGTAKLYVSASGHTGDSTSFTFYGPPLSLSWGGSPLVGAGQQDSRYVSIPNSLAAPLTIALVSSDPTKVAVPATVTIPAGSNYVYFNILGVANGTATITASATGYTSTSAGYTTTTPRLYHPSGGTLNAFAAPSSIVTYTADSTRGATHYTTSPVVITYASTNTAVLTVTGADTVLAGSYYANHATVTAVGAGTAKVVVTSAGYIPDTSSWTVQTPSLGLSWGTMLVGRRQYDQNRYVYTPNSRSVPVVVTLTQKHANVDSVTSTTITIPANSNIGYFNVAGLATGTDTITASATGYNPATGIVVVSTPMLKVYSIPATATTTTPPAYVTVYATDSTGSSHYVLDSLLVKATSSNTAVIQPTAAAFRFAIGAFYAQPRVAFVGPGSANMTYADSLATGYQPTTTNSVTVTGPSLSMSVYSSVLGMRQNGGATSGSVYIPNSIASPLTVNLLSTDTTVVTVPASVVIPAGSTSAYFTVTAHDAIGTIQVQATATGYSGANASVQVTQPKFVVYAPSSLNTTSAPQPITVYAADANGSQHATNENVVVTLQSSSTATATIDSASVTIPAGSNYNNSAHVVPVAQGTTVISAIDSRVAGYKYTTGQSSSIAINIPTLYLSSTSYSLGIGQYADLSVYTPDAQPAGRTVNLSHFSGVSSSPSSVSIPVGGTAAVYRVTGVSTGTDTITASATGHNPAKGAVLVAPGHPYASSWPASLSLTGTDSTLVTLYAYDVNNSWHYVSAATTFTLSGNVHVGFSNGTTAITSVTIPANAYYVQFYVKGLTLGTDAGIQIAATNWVTQTLSVTVNP